MSAPLRCHAHASCEEQPTSFHHPPDLGIRLLAPHLRDRGFDFAEPERPIPALARVGVYNFWESGAGRWRSLAASSARPCHLSPTHFRDSLGRNPATGDAWFFFPVMFSIM